MSKPPDPPPEFTPRLMARTGAVVLDTGLPALPGVLDYSMAIPVAYWAAATCAVVLFLQFSRDEDGSVSTAATQMTYARDGDRWDPHKWHAGTGWAHDPIASPQNMRDLDDMVMAVSGGGYNDDPPPGQPAAVVVGRARPAITHIALVQDGREDRRLLRSYFGAWVVCTERWSPYQINGIDADGAVLASLDGPPRLPSRGPVGPDAEQA